MPSKSVDAEALPLLIDTGTTFRVAAVANRLNRSASSFYRNRFGLGLQEWRLILVLGRKDRLTVGDAAVAADIDTAAASRALRVLADRGYVTMEMTASRGRATVINLTDEGRLVFEGCARAGAIRSAMILEGFSADEVKTFNALLDKLLVNAMRMIETSADEIPLDI